MTPAARIQAAIECLDQILSGRPAEQVLTGWARRSRFAGSKDRAAVRDHVFDVLRCKRSYAALGGAATGRGMMLGALRSAGKDPRDYFGNGVHGPDDLTAPEIAAGREPEYAPEALDIPDWLWLEFQNSLGARAEENADALRRRAPVHIRVNSLRASEKEALAALAKDGIDVVQSPASPTAFEVTSGARALNRSQAFVQGLVELQDAASQAAVDSLPLQAGMRVLDYCAGGGGKTLAMAARMGSSVHAFDAAPQRMRDLPARADRAGARVSILSKDELASVEPFDLVLCDAPCSGSGAWRRAPDGKWRLTRERLHALLQIQSEILDTASPLVRPGGILAYATCSLLKPENSDRVHKFVAEHPDWSLLRERQWLLPEGTDGFYCAQLQHGG